jgi:Lrp/AsnC family leucine-responsive transcriptional regulator
MIDEIDAKILNILGRDARLPNVEIARQVGMAPSGVLERIRKLETRGVVLGYAPRVNPQAVGLGLLAFIFIRTDERVGVGRTASLLAKVRQVQEVHHIAGEDCYLVKVRATDTEDLGRLLRDDFGRIKAIRSTRTTIVLETIKETAILPVTAKEKGK